MARNFYHLVCAGNDLAGLAAAAILARQGHRTLVLGEPQADHPSLSHQGQKLEAPPVLLTGLDTSASLRWIFTSLGIMQGLRSRLQPCIPGFQVVTPDHRLNVGGKENGSRQDWIREFPQLASPRIDQAMSGLRDLGETLGQAISPPSVYPPQTWLQRWRFTKTLKRLNLPLDNEGSLQDRLFDTMGLDGGEPIASALRLPVQLTRDTKPPDNPFGSPSGLRQAINLLGGVHTLEGGLQALRSLLLDRIATYGGTMELNHHIQELTIPWRSPLEMKISANRMSCGCDLLLWASPLEHLVHLLPANRRKTNKVRSQLNGLKPVAWRYTFHLIVTAESLPEAMASNVFLLADPSVPCQEENAMLITVRGEGDHRMVGLTCDVPAEKLGKGDDALEKLEDRMIATLCHQLIPFLERGIVERVSPSDPLEEHPPYGSPALQPLFSEPHSGLAGMGLAPVRTPYRRILLASRQVLPSLGLEGSFTTAISVALLAARLIGLKQLSRP